MFKRNVPGWERAHARQAREAGASKEEIAETAFVAAAVRAGGTLAHALLALRLYDGPSK